MNIGVKPDLQIKKPPVCFADRRRFKEKTELVDEFVNFDETSHGTAVAECNDAGDLGKESIVFAAADVEAGLVGCATLADDDGTTGDKLTAENFDAKPLSV
jgi:hypothetical protein